ncbi:osmotically inducible lipoprotein OsmE [Pseudomonas sp. Tn43]|uniref:osmotically-inducible lipoprotein OsmE n=1 Tax=unclassified Pseudomonas TaxID=196821 RepID=UPI000BAB9436|nr:MULTISPECIES: osmotically-inducible lipoprotein OsmE [unclassified Pseudomonas]MBB3239882.1 osmotically inducible lipoprotein OsmE [Pseudomonas sp. Tn43]PAU58342.1 cell envelope protein SmpA [Pseudomonas sp. PICF141]
MNKRLCALIAVLAASGGCNTESHIYRDQPLVAKVETGMSKEQVQQIGGQPLSITKRTVEPGTCFDYKLIQDGRQQPYIVSFDKQGKVDHKSFMTCAQWSRAQQKAREYSPSTGGMGGGGY